jgi:hypothetical protein
MMLFHHIAVISLPPGTGNCLSPAVAPNCYGLGEYSLGTPVTHTKCPQLNLTTPAGLPTGVIQRKCISPTTGNVTEGSECFSVPTAVWEPKTISGIGINGYWTDFTTSADKDLYGWLDGVLPDYPPAINNASAVPPKIYIEIGQAVLCRDKTITAKSSFIAGTVACTNDPNSDGCWMQGQIVGNSYDPNTWVCQLDDKTRQIIPYTPHANIRPLCFAKSGDHAFAEAKNMKSFDPDWRAKYGDFDVTMPLEDAAKAQDGSCDCMDPTCPTCCAFCNIAIPKAGYQCPTSIGLRGEILHYDTKTSHLYTPGNVTGVYFTDATYATLNVQVDGLNVVPQWGPQPGGADFLIPRIPIGANITETSFGQYVLCPSTTGAAGTYTGGKIFNTPMQTVATDNTYHIYTCDNEAYDPTKALKCLPADMLGLCYPTTL